MPKVAAYTLAWSTTGQEYELYESRLREMVPIVPGSTAWFAWLTQVSTFTFQGKTGYYTARKELRPHGDQYWYAYLSMGERRTKKYLGKTADLTLARLEQGASTLSGERDSRTQTQQSTPPGPPKSQVRLPTATADAGAGLNPVPHAQTQKRDVPVNHLLATKLHVPPLRSQLVPRSHLAERLQKGLEGALTLVSAPAGFGKTTLLCQWLGESSKPVAWLSLEPEDNEPTRFLSYAIAALQTLDPQIGTAALALLYAPQPVPMETALARLINDLTSSEEGDFVLVLDDYHVITAEPIHRALIFLLEHGPPQMHLVIATRVDPPLSLTRMRARGQLTEVRAAQLQFAVPEASVFLNSVMGLDLPSQDIATLQNRTEGWIAGLQLAALSLKGHLNAQQFITDFTGSHRHIVDYLVEEVLSRQPAEVQSFLLHTSILDRLTGPLCDAVTESSDGAAMLERLERANLFLVPLDEERQWYRYHHLFAEVLRARFMRQKGKQELAALYSRASEWYELNGFPNEAVEAALTAGDFSRAAALIVQTWDSMLLSYQQATLRHWLERLPPEMLHTDATLSLAYATSLFLTQLNSAYEPPLDVAERLFRAEGNRHGLGKVYALRAMTARPRGDASQAIEFGNKAIQLLPEEDLIQRSVSQSALGMGYRLTGDVAAAWPVLTQATALSQQLGNIITVLTTTMDLGALLVMQGKLHAAAETYQQVIVAAGERPRFASEALIGKGTLFYEWNELGAAEHHFQQAISLARQIEGTRLMSRGFVGLARVMQARGEPERAAELFSQALAQTERGGQSGVLEQAQAYQVRWWLAQSEMEHVARWHEAHPFTRHDAPRYEHEIEYLTFCRVLIAQGEAAEALQMLQRWQAFARTQGRTGSETEMLVLSALAHQAMGKEDQAVQLLENALRLAEAERYIRLFVDEGRPMVRLLTMLRPRQQGKARTDYVNTLLMAAGEYQPGGVSLPASLPATRPPAPVIEPLSQRERKVLRLLVAGMSHPEIADELVVSLNTVKTQVKSIYRKLNANNRKEARAIAQQLKLI